MTLQTARGAHRGPRPREDLPARRAPGPRPARRQPRHRGRRVRGGHGAVRLRQVDLHEPPRLPGHARRPARYLPRRRGRGGAVARRAGAHPQPEDRLRLPDLQPAAADDARSRTWSCRCSTARRCRPASGASGRWRGSGTVGLGERGHHTGRTSSRAASSSAWPSPARSSTSRGSSWPTSRPGTSTRAPASRSWRSSSG